MEHFKCLVCYINVPDIPQLHNHHMTHSLSDLSHALLSVQGLALLSQDDTNSHKAKYNNESTFKSTSQIEISSSVSTPQFSCSLCSKIMSSKRSLTKHVARHNFQKPFRCEKCDRGFNSKRDFDFHNLRLHSDGPKPYICDVCGKGFVEKHYLKVHATFHATDRNYTCETCPAAFKNVKSLRKHQKSHNTDRPFLCDSCPKTFKEKYDLTSHVRSVHLQEKSGGSHTKDDQASQTLVAAMEIAGLEVDMDCHLSRNELTNVPVVVPTLELKKYCETEVGNSTSHDVAASPSSLCSMPLLET